MTKAAKITTITITLLLATAGIVYAFRKKKPVASAIKKVGSIVWPDDPNSSGIETVNEDGSTVIKTGSKNQYVEQLKDVLNEIHKAVKHINTNCNTIKWGYFSQFPTKNNGDILLTDDLFTPDTAKVAQFYLNRQEVELDYLNEIRAKLAKWRTGSKCIYPLSV